MFSLQKWAEVDVIGEYPKRFVSGVCIDQFGEKSALQLKYLYLWNQSHDRDKPTIKEGVDKVRTTSGKTVTSPWALSSKPNLQASQVQ